MYNFKPLLNKAKEYYDNKMKYEIEKDKRKREQRYLHLSYFIYYSKYKELNVPKEERLYIHDGIRCEKCGVYPIQGHRYFCPICLLYNLCALCEKLEEYEQNPHEHGLIKLRKKEDLNSFNEKYKFEIEIQNMTKNFEIKTNKNNVYNINVLNKGKEPWPRDTSITCIKELSDLEIQEGTIGNVEPGSKKTYQLRLKNVNFRDSNVKNVVLTLKAKLRSGEDIKFLYPIELRIFNSS